MSGEPLRAAWTLDPAVAHLNHGSFGACPRAVLDEQSRLRARMESNPMRFFNRELEPLLDDARAALAGFLGARPGDLVFASNATAAVNAVLRSFAVTLAPGDELLTTSHAYPACKNALEFVARGAGARVVVAALPFPLPVGDAASSEAADAAIVEAVLARVTPRTRLALLDHVTSPTALVLPIAPLVAALRARGVAVLVDGAHAPGMVPLALDALDADWYTGNLHKWVCAPKGAAFLHARADRHDALRPLSVSHGATATRPDRSRLHLEFDWTGTDDFTPLLCVPTALAHVASLVSGGWDAVRARNHDLALRARRLLCDALALAPPCPDAMLGSMASLPIADEAPGSRRGAGVYPALQEDLAARFGVEIALFPWPARPRQLLRISAQIYNDENDYRRLVAALAALGVGGGG